MLQRMHAWFLQRNQAVLLITSRRTTGEGNKHAAAHKHASGLRRSLLATTSPISHGRGSTWSAGNASATMNVCFNICE